MGCGSWEIGGFRIFCGGIGGIFLGWKWIVGVFGFKRGEIVGRVVDFGGGLGGMKVSIWGWLICRVIGFKGWIGG